MWEKVVFVNSSNLQSYLLKVLRRVYFLSLNTGQWRRKCEVDSLSRPQSQIRFKQSWKLCLNLCSLKWLIPTLSLVISLIPLWSPQSKTLLGEGLTNFTILFLGTAKVIELGRISIVPFNDCGRKKRVFEKVVFN